MTNRTASWAYMSVKELKDELKLSGSDTLNVFFCPTREELAGAATWPCKEALTHQGGMVLNPSYFGTTGHKNTMIHEMGHIFGLYHVFKGVSERDSCDDPCQETTRSMETGDLCADTAPTTKSKACHDPDAVNDTCGFTIYLNTPYSNYMSYTDDNCTNHFTPNQVARMHCYLDLVYQKWMTDSRPAPVPLPPIVTGQSTNSVSIYWLPPMRGSLFESSQFHVSGIDCGDCEKDGVFHQYAFQASSPRICDTSGYWTPEEAVGPPDVEQACEASLQAWSSVIQGVKYQYTIQVETGRLHSPSPPLVYTHGQTYCGDGVIKGTEECDDSNLLDGDGCSKKCHKEMGFNCHGEPSQCYVFDGDGVCEEFERVSSMQDCGYFTPLGYTDQWASSASASHQDPNLCPAQSATGEPSLPKLCSFQHLEVSNVPTDAWFPCTSRSDTNNGLEHSYWIKVGFLHPGVAASVMVYLASDGSWSGEPRRRTVTILLSDANGKNHSLSTHILSCYRNPLVVNVTHDLSQPFFLTSSVILLFSSPSVLVRAVALRTSCHFSTFALTGCIRGCLQQPCQIDSCSRPQIKHASISCKGEGEASHCSVKCHRGYSIPVLNGRGTPPHQRTIELECFHGSWDRVVSCEPVDCGLPDQSHIYHAIFSCPWGTTFAKQCSFTCGPPAILQGDSDRLVCLEDGLWSFPEAYCKIECPEAPNIHSARLLTADCLSLKKKKPRKYFKLECLEDGQWGENACEPISCPALPDMFQGMYTCTNGLLNNTRCTLQCPDATENSEICCTKDRKWTAEFTMCSTLQGSCSAPSNLNYVEYSCDQAMKIGDVCYPTCVVALNMDLHDPVVLPNGTTPSSLKHWMGPTTVQSIICTGMMKWYPDPENIHCIQSCEPFGGDGWCDTINNRAYCQYDRGDCCPSTLSTRKVIQFGADCSEDEFTCRAPDAEENKSKVKPLD
ncbi:LOW QUALITY PROTEIN: pappalysin-2-like [Fundulus diaphanus]